MELQFVCDNCKCREGRKKEYIYRLKIEQVMDEKNIAQMFCPHCKTELKTK